MVMETTKSGPSIFKAMEAAVKPLAVSLKIIEKNTHAMTPEGREEKTRAEKIQLDAENKQIDILKDIKSNFAKSLKDSPIIKFFKNHWGKIILGAAIWKMKLSTFVTIKDTLVKLWKFFEEHPILAGAAAAAGFITFKLASSSIDALTSALGTVIALKWAGLLGGGGAGFIGPMMPGIGGKIFAAMGWAGIAVIIGKMIYDGFEGYHKSGEWNTSKFSSTIGGAIGGNKGGWLSSLTRGVAGGWLGFKLGGLFGPVGAVAGLIIGGAIGAVAGYFGGEKVAKWMDGIGTWTLDTWNKFTDAWEKGKGNYDEWARKKGAEWSQATDDFISGVGNAISSFIKGAIANAVSIWKSTKKMLASDINLINSKNLNTGKTDARTKTEESAAASAGILQPGQKPNQEALDILKRHKEREGNTGETSLWDKTKTGTDRVLDKITSPFKSKKQPEYKPPPSTDPRPLHPVAPDPVTETFKKIHSSVMDATNNAGAWLSGKFKLGKNIISDKILGIWNTLGVKSAPAFTSGYRGPDHPATKKNPSSLHAQGLAFDLRSKHLKRDGEFQKVSASLTNTFYPAFRGWNKKDPSNFFEPASARNNFNEHFHFQKAAKGYSGIVGKDGPRGFIAGEAGEELVRIQPLVSPDAKMHAMNALNAENQNIQKQSSSPTIITTTNSSSSQKTGDLNTFSQKQAHSNKKLVTSSLSA